MSNTPLVLATPTLAGIPIESKKQIIEELDVTSRLIMRNVSKIFRAVADDTPFSIDVVHIEFIENGSIKIKADDFIRRYFECGDEKFAQFRYSRHRSLGDTERIDAAIADLRTLLTMQNVTIKSLKITDHNHIKERRNVHPIVCEDSKFKKLEDLLTSLGHKLKVRALTLSGWRVYRQAKFIFLYLNPASIKEIKLDEKSWTAWESCHDMDQSALWNAAKSFIMTGKIGFNDFSPFAHFNNAIMTIYWNNLVESLQNLVQMLLRNPNLDQFVVTAEFIEFLMNDVRNHFGLQEKSEVMFDYPNSEEKLRFSIHQDYLVFRGPKYVERPLDGATNHFVFLGFCPVFG